MVLPAEYYTAGQDWYLMVNASAGAQWSIFTGCPWVQPLGTLGWTDNVVANGQYDIGEPALPSGSGDVTIGPEGIRFFRTIVPTGTPAWSLWLNGDTPDLAVRKNFVPFPNSYYDRKQAGQMLVVPPYLQGVANTYFLSVMGQPGDTVNLDSRIQEVSDIGFDTTQNNVPVPAAPYRVYRVQVPVQQIAWEIRTTPVTGNPNLCVCRDNVPAEFDNDGFSEVGGTTQDSVTLVPDFLTDATWFITVYGTSPYIRSWYSDSKNQGPYSYAGHDAAGTYNFTTPPLRPGHTYYAGFRSNNSATFSVSSATSGGSVGVLPVLAFYDGDLLNPTVSGVVPAGSSVLYQIPVPVEATRMKWTAIHGRTG